MNSPINLSPIPSIKPTIYLRPHHLLCLQTFVGHGYSPEFTAHMTYVKSLLDADSHAPITLVNGPDDLCGNGPDDLCGHCPNCVDNACTSPKPALFDHLVAQKLNLHNVQDAATNEKADASITSAGLLESTTPMTIHSIPSTLRMTAQLLDKCCPGCEWKELCIEFCKKKECKP